jgi:hypothetical protein
MHGFCMQHQVISWASLAAIDDMYDPHILTFAVQTMRGRPSEAVNVETIFGPLSVLHTMRRWPESPCHTRMIGEFAWDVINRRNKGRLVSGVIIIIVIITRVITMITTIIIIHVGGRGGAGGAGDGLEQQGARAHLGRDHPVVSRPVALGLDQIGGHDLPPHVLRDRVLEVVKEGGGRILITRLVAMIGCPLVVLI